MLGRKGGGEISRMDNVLEYENSDKLPRASECPGQNQHTTHHIVTIQ